MLSVVFIACLTASPTQCTTVDMYFPKEATIEDCQKNIVLNVVNWMKEHPDHTPKELLGCQTKEVVITIPA